MTQRVGADPKAHPDRFPGKESSSAGGLVSGRVGVVLVAAGASRRMGFDKIWAQLGGRTVLSYALELLWSHPLVGQLALVVTPARLQDARRLVARLRPGIQVCSGGVRRQDSVAAGLAALHDPDWVVVHDAARPFVTVELVTRGLEEARETGAAVAAIPASDTVKRVEGQTIVETIPRAQVWQAQTPQVFSACLLRRALAEGVGEVTDEATLLEQSGNRVRVFLGAPGNLKITTPDELRLAEAWLSLAPDESAICRRM